MLWENSPFTMLELRIITFVVCSNIIVLHENIDQTLRISLYGLLNCEIGGLNCCVITTENISSYSNVSVKYTCYTCFVMQ